MNECMGCMHVHEFEAATEGMFVVHMVAARSNRCHWIEL
jgi:hypothetical protein